MSRKALTYIIVLEDFKLKGVDMDRQSVFATVTFGSSGPVPAKMETIVIEIHPEIMVDAYAESFVKEGFRVNPLMAERVGLTTEEMIKYARFLLAQRVKSVKNDCPLYRKLKVLYIPSYLQYALSMIGEVTIRNKGLHLVPSYEYDDFSLEEAILVSDKVKAFEGSLQVVRDAMPRDSQGDVDTMSTALIAGYAMSIEKVESESSAYVASFLGFKLQEELAYKVLYRTQYDDLDYIASAILSRRELL